MKDGTSLILLYGQCINTVSKVQCHRTSGSKLRQCRKTHSITSCRPEAQGSEVERGNGASWHHPLSLPLLLLPLLLLLLLLLCLDVPKRSSPGSSSTVFWELVVNEELPLNLSFLKSLKVVL